MEIQCGPKQARRGPVAADARKHAAEDVVTIYKTFREKTPLAARGFFHLDARIVAALAGSDAGALNWLGTDGSSDYQHFELALDKARQASLLIAPCPRP